jgi:hypothetical protein
MLHTLKYFTCLLISLVGILVSSCSFYDESEIYYTVAKTSDGEFVVVIIDSIIVSDDEPSDEQFKGVLEEYIQGSYESEVVRLTMQEDNTVKWEVYQRSDSNVIRKLMD